jgi:hypothetical protein
MQTMIVVLTLLVSSCATTLRPAPGANVTPGPGVGAVAEREGVRVEARVEAWEGVQKRWKTR